MSGQDSGPLLIGASTTIAEFLLPQVLGEFKARHPAVVPRLFVANSEQVRAMFQGLDPATGEVRCAPLLRADPRSKLTAGPLLAALKAQAADQGVTDLEALAGSKALKAMQKDRGR